MTDRIALAKIKTDENYSESAIKARAQEFSTKMFLEIAPVVTQYMLQLADRQLQLHRASLDPNLSDEEKDKAASEYEARLNPLIHQSIRRETAVLVGGFTQDNFPSIYPNEEDTAKKDIERTETAQEPVQP